MTTPGRDDKEELRLREADLVRRVLKGDMGAFTELMEPYKGKIERWYRDRGNLWNDEDIEDAAQDTLESAYRSLHKFECEKMFAPWLYKIAMHRGIDKARREGRHRGTVSFESLVTDEETGQDGGWPDKRAEDPQELACHNEIVRIALEKLPERRREAFELRCRGLSIADIADVLDTTEDAVVVLLRRARKQFIEIYRKLGDEK